MRHPVKFRDDLTIARFGYSIDSLHAGSHSLIVVQCTNCSSITHREFRNKQAKHHCPVVNGDQKRCYKCEKWKDLSLFPKNGHRSGGVGKLCKECFNSHESVSRYEKRRSDRLRLACRTNDIEFYIKRKTLSIQAGARNKGIPFNLDESYLLELWRGQSGLCYYTKIPMDGKGRGFAVWNSPSLDKKDPSLGYTKGNVAWCLYSVNSFKNELTEPQFAEVIKQVKWWCL
jgi:hypothetical protein